MKHFNAVQEVFESEYSSNSTLTWVLRLVGLLLMFVGFNMVTRILVTLGELLYVPIMFPHIMNMPLGVAAEEYGKA